MGTNSLPYEIVHCSSWDDDYHPEQLVKSSPGNSVESKEVVKCKGWQTPKCPEYPQDLILHLLCGNARINKVQILSHHFKIATKIDVYVGILKDAQDVLDDILLPETPPSPSADEGDDSEQDNMLIEFTRLGYVCFDNNARAQFRARELKSIKINADGEYVRLVIRNCHRNRLNTYNQVGILALNIQGEPLHLLDKNNCSTSLNQIRNPYDDNSMLSSSTRRTSVSSEQSTVNRTSNNANGGFEIEQWTAALLAAEEEAVRNELYQIAKTYKFLGEKMDTYTKILSDLEIGKRSAVEMKNYDEAEKIKDDMMKIKQSAQLLLKQANIQIVDGQVLQQPEEFIIPTSFHQLEETVIGTEIPMREAVDHHQWMSSPPLSPMLQHHHHDDDIIPEEEVPQAYVDPDSIPEPIMDEERIPYTLAIQIFDEEIVACVLSIKVKCRLRGLGLIQQHIESMDINDVEMIPNFINAILMMIQEAVMDSRESVVTLAIDTWHQLNQFYLDAEITEDSVIEWMERTFSGLLKRTGDSNAKIKNNSIALVMTLIKSSPSLIPLYICTPERLIHNYKEAKSRIELVETTVIKLRVDPHNKKHVYLKDVMPFVVAYLNHNHDEVRQSAVRLVVTISDQIGFNLVSPFIDENLRKSLTETVQKLVDKDYQQQQQTKETISELRALTVVQPEKKVSSKSSVKKNVVESVKKPVSKTRTTTTVNATIAKTSSIRPTASSRKTTATSARSTKTTTKTKPAAKELDENSVCIFCDEVNSEFNENTLIKHYYNSCPVLTNCPMCQIITEISTLNEHMLMDCDRRHLIKECTRCNSAIPVEQWLQHSLKKTCSKELNCPLCLIHIEPANEIGWKQHLMHGEGCPKLERSRAPNKKK